MRKFFNAVLAAVVTLALMLASQPASAAQPSSAGAAGTKAPIATVGSRLDSAHSVPASRHGPPSGLPYRALDQAIYARAKAQAQQQAAHGIAPYARGDFSITASPGSQTVVRGSSTTYTVSTQATSGAPRPVSLSVSGLPAGATGTFNPASVNAGGSSVLTVSTTTATPAGTVGLVITGNYSSPPATHTTAVSLTVTAPVLDDFAIAASPSAQTVVQGSSAMYTVSTQVASGIARTVTLSAGGLGAGATGSFNPASVTAGGSSVLTIATTTTAATGTFTLSVAGQYPSGATHSTTVNLTVTAPVIDDFAISASPSAQSVVQGSSTTYTVSTQVASGTAQTVTLSVSGLGTGAAGSFNPTSVTAGGSSVLTIATTTTAATGTFTLSITGQYPSGATHSTAVSLTVSALVLDDFAISASPSAQTVVRGSSTTYTVDTQVTSGTARSVSLSISGLPAGASGAFAPAAVTAGQSATLTVTTTAAAAAGTSTLAITGQYPSGPTHSTSVSLVITAASATGPTIGATWNGQSEADLAPPDPTGAIGPNSYIQLINLRYGIYGRDGGLLNDGDLGALTLFPVGELTDPQIVWDPTSQLYYYLVLDYYNSAYAFGYSKSADPRSADDFCHYFVGAFYNGFYLPDYPKLAVTQDFVLVGTNVFLLAAFYVGSDVDWFQKPTDPVCPAQLGAGGIFGNLMNANGTQTSTPEPAVSADATSGGYVVGSADVGTGSASFLTLFKVTKNAQGYASISAPTPITVASYQMPANAPQSGTTQLIDTMDTRLTHAVAAYDPRIGSTAVWTAHAVFGGAGAEDRWYEINTGGAAQLAQSGRVTDPAFYTFNGAISPDRAADDATDATATTGRNMVMGFNTSSPNTFAALQMVSQRGTGAQSGTVLVKQSVGPYVDFSCGSAVPNVCRWGDYGGATPDPLRAMGGQVWLSGEWNNPMTDGTTPTWQTWNWSATP